MYRILMIYLPLLRYRLVVDWISLATAKNCTNRTRRAIGRSFRRLHQLLPSHLTLLAYLRQPAHRQSPCETPEWHRAPRCRPSTLFRGWRPVRRPWPSSLLRCRRHRRLWRRGGCVSIAGNYQRSILSVYLRQRSHFDGECCSTVYARIPDVSNK